MFKHQAKSRDSCKETSVKQPGHPASVSLTTLLPGFLPRDPAGDTHTKEQRSVSVFASNGSRKPGAVLRTKPREPFDASWVHSTWDLRRGRKRIITFLRKHR